MNESTGDELGILFSLKQFLNGCLKVLEMIVVVGM